MQKGILFNGQFFKIEEEILNHAKTWKDTEFWWKAKGEDGKHCCRPREEKKSFHLISNLKSENFLDFYTKILYFIKKEEQFFCKSYLRPDI